MAAIVQELTAEQQGRRWVVAGLGVTGLSVVRYLRARGVICTVCDSRERPPALDRLRAELPEVDCATGAAGAAALATAEVVVVSPGLALDHPMLAAAREAGAELLGDIELFAREARAPVVAITGSNGKSSVTTMVGEMARRAGRRTAVGGNIGTPALDLLADTEPDLYVLELSSFQLDTVQSLAPRAATVLNVSADHMDRYPDLAHYAASKGRIYERASFQVVNMDDPVALGLATGPGRRIGFSLAPPEPGDYGLREEQGRCWLARGAELLMPCEELQVGGRHNQANALAAMALGETAGLPVSPMLQALREFRGLPHRMQSVAERRGVRWIDDSKATNPGAAAAAIDGLDGPLVLIAGGDGKDADFAVLRAAVAPKVKACVLMGRDAPRLRDCLTGAAELHEAADMDAAVRLADSLAEAGDTVLLSPGCASLDMFSSYVQRGEAFAAALRRLAS